MKELEQENAFYEAHKEEFREKYLDKWLLITGDKLYGIYDKIADAAKEAIKQNMEPGHFMIHKPADDGKIIQFGPRLHVDYSEEGKKPVQRESFEYSDGEPIKVTYAY